MTGEEDDGRSLVPASSRGLRTRSASLVKRGLESLLRTPEAQSNDWSIPFYQDDLDHLTGLAKSRRFRLALLREVERWRRYGVPCALLLLDVDHMKAINDRFGHPAGDVVIQHVGTTLIAVSRDNDTTARLGGEVGVGPSIASARLFALLLAGLDEAKASRSAERLRSILAEHPIEGVGNISVSIGVAACPAHANSERTLFDASDQALHVAKNQGRNRVSVAPLLQENLLGV